MKKLIRPIQVIVLIAFAVLSLQLKAETKSNPSEMSSSKTMDAIEVQVLLDRLKEMGKMEKSILSKIEKNALQKEMRGYRRHHRRTSDYVYAGLGIAAATVLVVLFFL